MKEPKSKALLVLADGTVFEGLGCGAPGEAIGEVVFNTSMTGYQEILTDPSYKGQIVVMTYTQTGNYGINRQDNESSDPKVEGFVMRECFDFPSSWRSEMNLVQYLKENNIVGIDRIDTRALTRHLRDNGVQMGIISTIDFNPDSLLQKVRQHPGISSFDLVREVTTKASFTWTQSLWRINTEKTKPGAETHGIPKRDVVSSGRYVRNQRSSKMNITVFDFGIKFNILRHLAEEGFEITVVPATSPAEEVLERADAVVLGNGPGDPQTVTYAVETAKKLIGKKPILGICLGHQILGLALGGKTYKLKFGHHGGNHPVMELATGKVEITSQNHNYCVDVESLKGQVVLTHRNLYDGTEEGFKHKDLPILSIQYHPEAGPGPNDAQYIFARFKEMINQW